MLSTPLLAELRAAYPEAAIDVLASPSNHEVFEADPHVDRVRVAERTWFERRPDRWGLLTAVWNLGRSLPRMGYDLGIDVRGDVLTVLVLALAGVPRRVGWSMGGGAFLLTDVAAWIPGRHEVRSRLALLERLGITPDLSARVDVHVGDEDRIAIARRLAEAWPRRGARRIEARARIAPRGRLGRGTGAAGPRPDRSSRSPTRPTGCTPIGSPHSLRSWPCISEPGTRPSAGRPARGRVLVGRFLETAGGSSWSGGRRPSALDASWSLTTGSATGPAP